MILGYLLALLGATGSGLGSVLESLGVRRAGAYGGDADDLGRVARQPVYWSGLLVDLIGFLCAAAALASPAAVPGAVRDGPLGGGHRDRLPGVGY